jgi:hypothetical protein
LRNVGCTRWAGVTLLVLAGACGGRSRALGAGDGSTTSSAGGAPSSEGPPALAGYTGHDIDIDTAEPQAGIDPKVDGSAFFWAYGLGNWFIYAPPPNPIGKDAPIADLVPPRGDSAQAYRVAGSDEPKGVELFAQLRHPENTALDLSAYYGIGFWAKLEGTSENLIVALNRGDHYSLSELGGEPSVGLVAATDWQRYELSFAEFVNDGSKIATIDFIVGQDGGTFDLWVNDLALLCRGTCPDGAH